jgi:hypothetical protein
LSLDANDKWLTGQQYSLYRLIFGTYLFIHFAELIAWGPELFSDRGVLPNPTLSPLAHLFPNVLALWDSAPFIQGLLALAAALSVLFAVGLWDKIAAVTIWYIWACLLGRNPLISNPSIPFVGWLLLAHTLLPGAPKGSLAAWKGKCNSDWQMSPDIYAFAWILMALGYTYSGYTKLVSPSWVDGTALSRVLHNPLARADFLNNTLLAMPSTFLRVATWAALALELTFGPLALSRRCRPIIWTTMLGLHIGLLTLINFADLSAGIIVFHLFTFDPAWVIKVPSRECSTEARAI